jgi:hypothetical protein
MYVCCVIIVQWERSVENRRNLTEETQMQI